jgi:hypothetical protein
MKTVYLFSVLIFVSVSLYSEYSPNVRNDQLIEKYFWRVAARYGIPLPESFFTGPIPLSDIQSVLSVIDSLHAADAITRKEYHYCSKIRNRLSPDSTRLAWQLYDGDIVTRGQAALSGKLSSRFTRERAFDIAGTISPRLSGSIKKLSFYSEIDVSTLYSSDTLYPRHDYEPYNGVPYNLYGRADSSHIRSSDVLRGGVLYRFPYIAVESAVDYLRQGPALHNPLTFSGDAPPVTYFRGRFDLIRAFYTHTFGLLKSQKAAKKYFYTHRLGLSLFQNRFYGGINEVIVTGSSTDEPLPAGDTLMPNYQNIQRDWEWVYMIPFVPYAFAEHYVGDRDNALLSFDMTVMWPRAFRWYIEVLLDDITAPWTLLSDDWGNKWAAVAGGQFFGVVWGKDITATVEYTRIEPWVYTHFGGGSHRYTHFGQSLGSSLGPNADELVVELDAEIVPAHTAGIIVANRRKNQNRGGNIRHVFRDPDFAAQHPGYYTAPPDSKKKRFLGPGTTRSTRIGLFWLANPFGLFSVRTNLSYRFGDGDNFAVLSASGGLTF